MSKTTSKSKRKPVPAEKIAEMASQGKDVTPYYSGKGVMISSPSTEEQQRLAAEGVSPAQHFRNRVREAFPASPPQRVNVDFAPGMLSELDEAATSMNISRQALIKTLLRDALDRQRARRALSVRGVELPDL